MRNFYVNTFEKILHKNYEKTVLKFPILLRKTLKKLHKIGLMNHSQLHYN